MRPNPLRELWAQDLPVVNGWLSLPDSVSAEVMAHQGWDSLTVDWQHGLLDHGRMLTMLQAISTTHTVPLVRVPWLEPSALMKSLDAGAYGVICPGITTPEQARQLVAWTQGSRSFGPVRASLYGGADYLEHANASLLRFAMIDSVQALDHLDAICAVRGLDAVYVGPSELAVALGYSPHCDELQAPVAQAIALVLACARRHGLVAGIHCRAPGAARARIADGFRFVTVSSDVRLLAAGSQALLSALRAPHKPQ